MNRRPDDIEEPPEALAATFHEHLERATELAAAAVRRAPDDSTAQYEFGVTAALNASYRGSILGERLGALGPARRAYQAHRRVLELDPTRNEAKLLVGLYRYVVASMPRALRWMAYLMGFDGGKEEAIELVAEAAAHPGEIQAEARFALVLLYNRERQYARAPGVCWTSFGGPSPATAWSGSRPRPPGCATTGRRWPGWRWRTGSRRCRATGGSVCSARMPYGTSSGARRGRRSGSPTAARLDLARAAHAPAPSWVTGRAHLELGKLSDLAGDRGRARDHYARDARGRDLCGEAGHHRCERAARGFRTRPYSGSEAAGEPRTGRGRHRRRGRR